MLTESNYNKGFLIQGTLLGAVCESSGTPGAFMAYVVDTLEGTVTYQQERPTLQGALTVLGSLPGDWAFEPTSECGQGKCGKKGSCETGGGHSICQGCGLNPKA